MLFPPVSSVFEQSFQITLSFSYYIGGSVHLQGKYPKSSGTYPEAHPRLL